MYSIAHLDIPPLSGIAGSVRLPGSKSISNRVLLLAGLATGETAVHGLLDSDDTAVMLEALGALGCGIARDDAGVSRVRGLGVAVPEHAPPREIATLVTARFGASAQPLADWLLQLETQRYARAPAARLPALRRQFKRIPWPA